MKDDEVVTMSLTAVDIERLRADTPGCGQRLHLNNAGASLLSSTTLAAMRGHLDLEAHIGGYEAAAEAQSEISATYDNLARLVGTKSEHIALFDNSTHAWNAAFYSIGFGAGDRILTGRDEYGSNVLAYLQVAQRTGAEVVIIPNDEHGQLDIDALRDLMDERVKLVGVTWVPTAGGLVNPVAEIARVVRDADALYLIDATQVVGQLPIDVTQLGCDLLTGTGRKFLRGPRGTGFLFVGDRALAHLEPFVAEIRSATWDGRRSFTWVDGARRFETWENSCVNQIGLGAAVAQSLALGLDAIAERAVALGSRLRNGLRAVEGTIIGDLGREQCAIVTAALDGTSASDVAARFAEQGINVSTTVAEHNQFDTEERGIHPLVRLSPHYYNTEAEIDRALDVMSELARRRR